MKVAVRNSALVAFALAGVLIGCSGGSGDSGATPPATTGAAAAPPTAPATPPANTPPANTPPAGGGATASTATDGATLFAQNCSGCHGDKGAGGKRAPTLAGSHTPEAKASEIVTNGKGRMPKFAGRLNKDQIDAIAKYVATL